MSAPSLPDFMALFPEFRASTWDGWRAILERVTPAVREFYCAVGRGGGKSRIAALIACAVATREYRLVSGENVYIGVFGPDKKQAGITFRYVVGLMKSRPELAALIVRETADSLTLATGIVIEVLTASIAAPRGRSYAGAIVEEAAFLPQDQSSNPDTELLRAIRPALARVPGSLLVVISSPYSRRGILFDAYQKYHGQPDGEVVFVQAGTLELNPAFDSREVQRALEEDPEAAKAEYLAEFRSDLESYVDPEVLARCTVQGRTELAYQPSVYRYAAFMDPASGSGSDSFTWAIAHEEWRQSGAVVVLDLVREVRPPFSPAAVCAECAGDLQRYGVTTAVADKWGGAFTTEALAQHGVTVFQSARPKSELYGEVLGMLNSGRVELLDVPRLAKQFIGLERRTARGGRDSIDHAPSGRDDVCNSVAGVCVELLRPWGAPVDAPPVEPALSWLDVFNKPEAERVRALSAAAAPPVVVTPRAERQGPGKAVTDFNPLADDLVAERRRANRAAGYWE